MPQNAYWVGRSIVAAYDPAEAVAVMERHEPAGKYRLEQVADLLEEELWQPVDPGSPDTVATALSRCGHAQLIRWDYPRQ
ncbi:hypothetical protein D3C78_427320 [compost metagenome]